MKGVTQYFKHQWQSTKFVYRWRL